MLSCKEDKTWIYDKNLRSSLYCEELKVKIANSWVLHKWYLACLTMTRSWSKTLYRNIIVIIEVIRLHERTLSIKEHIAMDTTWNNIIERGLNHRNLGTWQYAYMLATMLWNTLFSKFTDCWLSKIFEGKILTVFCLVITTCNATFR